MNFDLNMLSSLMQLLGSGSPSQRQEPAAQRQEPARGENKSASPFARENGIGEKVDIGAGEQKMSPPNPMANILDALGGKPASGDMMSALLPMLMNMFKKTETPNASPAANAAPTSKDEEQRAKCASADVAPKSHTATKTDNCEISSQNRRPLADAEIFSPISFAGYALISALNILYHSAK